MRVARAPGRTRHSTVFTAPRFDNYVSRIKSASNEADFPAPNEYPLPKAAKREKYIKSEIAEIEK